MSASSSAIRTRADVSATSSVLTEIISRTAPILDRGAVSRLVWTHPLWWEAVVSRPSYPNWQRKRIQNPSSVSSNLTEGTHKPRVRASFHQPAPPLAWSPSAERPQQFLRPYQKRPQSSLD